MCLIQPLLKKSYGATSMKNNNPKIFNKNRSGTNSKTQSINRAVKKEALNSPSEKTDESFFVYGIHAVSEALDTNANKIEKLYFDYTQQP